MNKKIIWFCIIALLLVFLSIGEHESREMNVILSKIGLKSSYIEQVETDIKPTSGLAALFDNGRVTKFNPNYIGFIAYISIFGVMILSIKKVKKQEKT